MSSEKIISFRIEVPEKTWRAFTNAFPREISIQKKLNQMIEEVGKGE